MGILAQPSVLALARRLGLSNATFWRHFRDIATEIRHPVGDSMAQPGGQNPRRERPGIWPARTPGCGANGTGWPINWKPPSATCDGSPSTTSNCATTCKQPAASPVSTQTRITPAKVT